ncbi:hypothetical protein EVJ58_g3561 [Rhodofomes roseus]|uniref:Uncharacterized protein n=1 Tax=Rhodofomes roseus TaxID=34475 RepID=A0A4Y9YN46_9APHY|nr:hypothetical protein EVJ58_g3561 [Rhodofomes roseus]
MSAPNVDSESLPVDAAVQQRTVDEQPEGLIAESVTKEELTSEPKPVPPEGWDGRGKLNKPTVVMGQVKTTKPPKPK